MQITILSVAAKPQQFFKGKKKLKKNPYHCPVSNIWTSKSVRVKYLCWSMWFLKPGWKIPPSKKPRGKSVPRGEEGWLQECWAHCVDRWCAVFWVKGTRGTETSLERFHDRKLLSLLDFQPEGVVSGPAGVIRWSDVVCSAPFLHARYPVSERSCKADKQRGSGWAAGGSLQAGWALPELMSHTASRWTGSQAQAHCSSLACPLCLKGLWDTQPPRGRWRDSCDKKLETYITIVHFQKQPGSHKLLSLSVSRGYWEIHHCFVCFYFPFQLAMLAT